MAVNPVNSGSNYVSQVQPQPQSPAERAAELAREKEKSQEAANKSAAVNTPPKPTVNTSGQTVSTVVDVKA